MDSIESSKKKGSDFGEDVRTSAAQDIIISFTVQASSPPLFLISITTRDPFVYAIVLVFGFLSKGSGTTRVVFTFGQHASVVFMLYYSILSTHYLLCPFEAEPAKEA